MRQDDAEADPGIRLDLALQVLGELLVALPGDHREGIDVEAAQALAVLVHAKPKAAPDRLPPCELGPDVAQGAYLEDIGVVPSLAQGRMGEDELERLIEAQQLLLVPHDEVVGALGVFAIGLVVLRGVRPAAPSVDGEVAVVNRLGGRREVYFPEQRLVVGMPGEAPVLLLEQAGVIALDRVAFVIVAPVTLHGIDEEEAQHLDPLRAQAPLLVEMLADGSLDHLAVKRRRRPRRPRPRRR